MKEFLMSCFNNEVEREEFLRWYNFEEYRTWLTANKYTSTLDNLKTYKKYVTERVRTLQEL